MPITLPLLSIHTPQYPDWLWTLADEAESKTPPESPDGKPWRRQLKQVGREPSTLHPNTPNLIPPPPPPKQSLRARNDADRERSF